MSERSKKIIRVIIVGFLFLVAACFIFAGLLKSRPVHESGDSPMYHKVRDWRLVIDATFSGVVKEEGRLITTYDRSKKVGKRACPT